MTYACSYYSLDWPQTSTIETQLSLLYTYSSGFLKLITTSLATLLSGTSAIPPFFEALILRTIAVGTHATSMQINFAYCLGLWRMSPSIQGIFPTWQYRADTPQCSLDPYGKPCIVPICVVTKRSVARRHQCMSPMTI